MNKSTSPFEQLIHTILQPKPVEAPRADWRRVEARLVEYFKTHRVDALDAAGDPVLCVVRHFEMDEPVVATISVERLAKYLAEEIAR